MRKLKTAGYLLRDMASSPMDLKPARRLFRLWVAVTVLDIATLALAVITGIWWSAAVSGTAMIFALVMLRWAAIRLADAKHLEEKRAWERSMFEEWSR